MRISRATRSTWKPRGAERAAIAKARRGWLEEDGETVAERYRKGEIDEFDMVRRYGVIVDWGTGEYFPKTTAEFRTMMKKRSAAHWNDAIAELDQAAE